MSAPPMPPVPPPAYGQVEQDDRQKAGYQSAPYPQQPAGYAPQAGYGYPPQGQGYPPPAAPYGYSQPPPAQQPYGQPAGYSNAPASNLAFSEEEHVFNEDSFADKAVRHQFIRKVYLILMCQLLFTFSIVAVFVLVDSVRHWVQQHSWIYFIAYAGFLVTYIVLACIPSVRRKYPGNYICLAVFTIMFTYMCAMIASYHTAEAVMIAAGITAAVTLGISLFACQTKIDFTRCFGLIFAASLVLIIVGFLYIILWQTIPYDNGRNRYFLQCAYGGVAALILCLFLVFDTQRVMGGKNRKYALSPEEHVLGALELYLDVVYIFLIILSFFGGSRD